MGGTERRTHANLQIVPRRCRSPRDRKDIRADKTKLFANMRRFVTKYISACLNCAYYKHTVGKKQGKLNVIEKVPAPWHTVHIDHVYVDDHVGPFETSRKQHKFILVLVDAFTKFTIVEPVRSQKASYVIKILTNFIYLFRTPTRLISDRGTAFTSQAFRMFCDSYGIKHVLNAVAIPRANGQCERYNKTIVQALATTTAGRDLRDWDTVLKQVQSAINTTHNKGINTTPMKVLIGCEVRSPAEASLLSQIKDTVHQLDLSELREEIKAHIDRDQQQKER